MHYIENTSQKFKTNSLQYMTVYADYIYSFTVHSTQCPLLSNIAGIVKSTC